MTNPISRRDAVRHLFVLAAGSALLPACKKELSCADATGLSPEDAATRTTLNYLDKAPDPTKVCLGCGLFQPAAPDACGACTIVKGTINPAGSCNSWVKKQG